MSSRCPPSGNSLWPKSNGAKTDSPREVLFFQGKAQWGDFIGLWPTKHFLVKSCRQCRGLTTPLRSSPGCRLQDRGNDILWWSPGPVSPFSETTNKGVSRQELFERPAAVSISTQTSGSMISGYWTGLLDAANQRQPEGYSIPPLALRIGLAMIFFLTRHRSAPHSKSLVIGHPSVVGEC